MKIAVIWGEHLNDRQWTTHHQFWEESIKHFQGVTVYRYTWANWETMPTDYDLYFFIDFHPSIFKVCRTQYHPRIFYWFDSFHHSFVYPAQVVDCFDRSYFAEYQAVEALNRLGVSKVSWLPPAFYPGLYRNVGINDKHYDWSFIGQPDNTVIRNGFTRREFFEKLYNENRNSVLAQGVYGDELNLLYNNSKVLIDRTIYYNIGTRFFETIGSGGFLLANRSLIPSGVDKLAFDGIHYISYDDSYDDCLKKLKYYLNDDAARQRIASAGSRYFAANHTYTERFKSILHDLGVS